MTSDKDNLTLVFSNIQRREEEEEEAEEEEELMEEYEDYHPHPYEHDMDEETFFPFQNFKYRTNCCYGLSMDLLENIAQELEFDFR